MPSLNDQQFPGWEEPSHEQPEHVMTRPDWEAQHAPWHHSSFERQLKPDRDPDPWGDVADTGFHAGTFGAAMERNYGERPYMHRGRVRSSMANTPETPWPDPMLAEEGEYDELEVSSQGGYYRNVGEDYGSISVALPGREGFETYGDMLKRAERRGERVNPLNKAVGQIPQPVTGEMVQLASGLGMRTDWAMQDNPSVKNYPAPDPDVLQHELFGPLKASIPERLDPVSGKGYRPRS